MPASTGFPPWVREPDRSAEFKNGGGRYGIPWNPAQTLSSRYLTVICGRHEGLTTNSLLPAGGWPALLPLVVLTNSHLSQWNSPQTVPRYQQGPFLPRLFGRRQRSRDLAGNFEAPWLWRRWSWLRTQRKLFISDGRRVFSRDKKHFQLYPHICFPNTSPKCRTGPAHDEWAPHWHSHTTAEGLWRSARPSRWVIRLRVCNPPSCTT